MEQASIIDDDTHTAPVQLCIRTGHMEQASIIDDDTHTAPVQLHPLTTFRNQQYWDGSTARNSAYFSV